MANQFGPYIYSSQSSAHAAADAKQKVGSQFESAAASASTCDHIWLRAEVQSKPPRGVEVETSVDRRSPLTPADAQTLVDNGFQVCAVLYRLLFFLISLSFACLTCRLIL